MRSGADSVIAFNLVTHLTQTMTLALHMDVLIDRCAFDGGGGHQFAAQGLVDVLHVRVDAARRQRLEGAAVNRSGAGADIGRGEPPKHNILCRK